MSTTPTVTPRPMKYVRPEVANGKKIVKLCRTDRMIGAIQVLTHGGETNLHSHAHSDGLWFVLSGRVRFYGPEDNVIGEYGRYEGGLIPRECPYWFEAVGDEIAELLQVEAFDKSIPDDKTLFADRTDYKPRSRTASTMIDAAS
jgi:mannose-6-phosphate isomerase-like protein (cupin superfamily)